VGQVTKTGFGSIDPFCISGRGTVETPISGNDAASVGLLGLVKRLRLKEGTGALVGTCMYADIQV
jgi:hypothetical protein